MRVLPFCRACALVMIMLPATGCQLLGAPDDPLEAFREEVRQTVPDPDRVDQMLTIVDRLEALVDESFEVALAARRGEQALFADYDSTRADYDAVIDRIRIQQERIQAALIDAAFELRDKATPEEWAELTKAKARATEQIADQLLARLLEKEAS